MEANSLLKNLHQRWSDHHHELVRVITVLTPDQLRLRAAPHLHSIGEMVAHLVAARARMFHLALGEGTPELAPMARWDDNYIMAQDRAMLLHGLAISWQMIEQALQHWTLVHLQERLEQTWPSGETSTFSRSYIVSYALKHDFHHGGEILLTLGMYGLESPKWT
jgi:uncharacterized damage-inducible protein DinB